MFRRTFERYVPRRNKSYSEGKWSENLQNRYKLQIWRNMPILQIEDRRLETDWRGKSKRRGQDKPTSRVGMRAHGMPVFTSWPGHTSELSSMRFGGQIWMESGDIWTQRELKHQIGWQHLCITWRISLRTLYSRYCNCPERSTDVLRRETCTRLLEMVDSEKLKCLKKSHVEQRRGLKPRTSQRKSWFLRKRLSTEHTGEKAVRMRRTTVLS